MCSKIFSRKSINLYQKNFLGKKLRCKVNCQEGFCTARNKNVKNSCECICGEDPCS